MLVSWPLESITPSASATRLFGVHPKKCDRWLCLSHGAIHVRPNTHGAPRVELGAPWWHALSRHTHHTFPIFLLYSALLPLTHLLFLPLLIFTTLFWLHHLVQPAPLRSDAPPTLSLLRNIVSSLKYPPLLLMNVIYLTLSNSLELWSSSGMLDIMGICFPIPRSVKPRLIAWDKLWRWEISIHTMEAGKCYRSEGCSSNTSPFKNSSGTGNHILLELGNFYWIDFYMLKIILSWSPLYKICFCLFVCLFVEG